MCLRQRAVQVSHCPTDSGRVTESVFALFCFEIGPRVARSRDDVALLARRGARLRQGDFENQEFTVQGVNVRMGQDNNDLLVALFLPKSPFSRSPTDVLGRPLALSFLGVWPGRQAN